MGKLKNMRERVILKGTAGLFGVQSWLYQLANYTNVRVNIQKYTEFLNVVYVIDITGDVDNINEYKRILNDKINSIKKQQLI